MEAGTNRRRLLSLGFNETRGRPSLLASMSKSFNKGIKSFSGVISISSSVEHSGAHNKSKRLFLPGGGGGERVDSAMCASGVLRTHDWLRLAVRAGIVEDESVEIIICFAFWWICVL